MRLIRAAIALILFSTTAAQALEVPCDQVAEIERAARLAIHPALLSTTVVAPSGRCEVRLSDLVAPPILAFVDRKLEWNGPNCWSTALYLKGMRPYMVYAHEGEFNWHVDRSHQCRKLGAGEQPEPGDVGAIRQRAKVAKGFEELHAFIYLTSEVSVSKQSFVAGAPIEITTPEKYLAQFGGRDRDSDCEMNPSCTTWTSYYRCEMHETELGGGPAVSALLKSFAFDLSDDWMKGPSLVKNPPFNSNYLPRVDEGYRLMRLPNGDFDRSSPHWLRFESLVYQFASMQSQL